MTPEEKERIDRITQVVHYLSKGKMPDPIPCEQDPDDEIRQLCEKVNTLSQHFIEVKEFIVPLSCGKLDGALPKRNFLASPFKQLQSALNGRLSRLPEEISVSAWILWAISLWRSIP